MILAIQSNIVFAYDKLNEYCVCDIYFIMIKKRENIFSVKICILWKIHVDCYFFKVCTEYLVPCKKLEFLRY